MIRGSDAVVWVAIAAITVLLSVSCQRESAASAPARSGRETDKPAGSQPKASVEPVQQPSRLPEDPIAGKRSELQWREHLEEEERERQLGFDRRRMKEHRAVVRMLAAARARYDPAPTEAAVAKVRAAMPARMAEVRRRVTKIDRWGVNSRLLQDYDALATVLSGPYADAKVAALRGDEHALAEARAAFDQRMKTIADWLEEAAESEYY